MKQYAIFILVLLMTNLSRGQIDVFGQGCFKPSPSIFNSFSGSFSANCIEIPSVHSDNYSFTGYRELKATSYIEFGPDTEFAPNSSNSAMDAYIEPAPFDVVAYVNSLDNIKKLEKFELGIRPDDFMMQSIENFIQDSGFPKINPFLSWNIRVKAVFEYQDNVFPGMQTIFERDAFFTREFIRDLDDFDDLYNLPENATANGVDYETLGGTWVPQNTDYPFRVRFAPPRTGLWSCKIVIEFNNGNIVSESPSFQFTVVSSNKKGYLRRDNNNRFLKRDGNSFMPLGLNMPWPLRDGAPMQKITGGIKPINFSVTAPIAAYEQYKRQMDTLAQNDINYFRMIMCPWSLDIEYEEMGNYYDRLHIAKEMDLILERAEQHELLIQWNMMVHFGFQENSHASPHWDWDGNGSATNNGNPYKIAFNLNSPIEFFTHTNAKKYYKERMRYIVARWGYSPNIGMFELFSEIDQAAETVSNEYDEAVVYAWHEEMSDYLKDELKIPQLLSASYTGAIDNGEPDDNTYLLDNIDVINYNNYNNEGDIFKWWYEGPRGDFSNSGSSLPRYRGNYGKPVFYSETMAVDIAEDCIEDQIEIERSILQNAFTGISGGLLWYKPEDFSIYSTLKTFMGNLDLEGENWHPGIVKRENNGDWKYMDNYRKNCIRENDENASVVYLRSKDEKKALGVITNHTYNYFTISTCLDNSGNVAQMPSNPNLQSFNTVSPSNGGDKLRLRNMGTGLFRVYYYDIDDPTTPINNAGQLTWGPNITLQYPHLGMGRPFIFFKAFRANSSFIPPVEDTIPERQIRQEEEFLSSEEYNNDVLFQIYPNPNDGNFVFSCNVENVFGKLVVYNQLSEKLFEFKINSPNQEIRLDNIASGTYWVVFIDKVRVYRSKFFVNK